MAKANDPGPIHLRRAYDDAGPDDGYRVLVDRLWPRGISKAALQLDEWCKAVAPSADLRRWFGHDAAKWAEFQERYRAELAGSTDVGRLADEARRGAVTLVYGARDREHNDAVVLREVLLETLGRPG